MTKENFHLQIDSDDKKQLEHEAKNRDRSLSSLIRTILKEWLNVRNPNIYKPGVNDNKPLNLKTELTDSEKLYKGD